MKKIFTILLSAITLMGGMMFTGCSEEDDDFFGPSNTWCEAPITKTDAENNKVTVGYLAAIYCDEDYTVPESTSGSKNLPAGTELKAGITIVVWGNPNADDSTITGSILNGLSKSTYVTKTFAKDSDTEVSDGENTETSKVKGSKLVWKAAYIFNNDLHNADTQYELPAAPEPLLSSSYSDVSDTLKDFSWKSVLKQYLINSL